jgi:hypothetical protein
MQKLIAIFCFKSGTIESRPKLCAEIENLKHGIRLDDRVILFLSDQTTSDHRASFERHLEPQDEVLVFRVERGAWKLSAARDKWLRDFLSTDQ